MLFLDGACAFFGNSAKGKAASASAGDTKGKCACKRGMAAFAMIKGGLMFEASIGGQKYNFKPLMAGFSIGRI